ncbi:hypothetical protein L596_005206 [Steinernema carpocapsae]|uniref:Protein kinase domain-containing protein n=1 Tax=Steinernema carpocapsae TaxID=34508 RepID=A0A4U8V1W0_STECR|nr:hypothetical protein L596_005206 [Steinernema carpocapsae]
MRALVAFVVVQLIAFIAAQEAFAITDKVGQGNFAKVFAYGDDGLLYRLGKRSENGPESSFAFALRDPRQRFAKHNGKPIEFAFAKRANFAKRDNVDEFAFAKRRFAFA